MVYKLKIIVLTALLVVQNSNFCVGEALQQDFEHMFPDYFDEPEEYAAITPCNVVHPGDPDLTTYDIISSYNFDEYSRWNRGVQKIAGSTNYQTAYHIEEYTNTTISSSQAFPKGMPMEFSFECTFRLPQLDPYTELYLFELNDYQYESQMSVSINQPYNRLEFSLPKFDGSMQTVSFEEIEIFDRSWHKVMLGVTQDSVRLWVDCKPVPDRTGILTVPLDIRGPVDITEGSFTVARNCMSRATVPIDLQWMIFSCDVQKPYTTSCADLPVGPIYPNVPPIVPTTPVPEEETLPPLDLSFLTTSTQIPWLLSTSTPSALQGTESHACPVQCPQGPPGPPGPPGVVSGNYEMTYMKGEKGEPGLSGLPGSDGFRGERGFNGTDGVKGEQGEIGVTGMPGPIGPPGPPGPPGIAGIMGKQETTSKSIEEREIREICMAVVKEYITEISTTIRGAVGPPGRPGIGRPGPPGAQGVQGHQGPPGMPGLPGIGFPGPQGDVGPRGEVGEKGDRGDDGVGYPGPMGPVGPPGPEGRGLDGIPGRPGDRGEPGRSGASGPQGPPGQPGICPDCNAYQAYAYPMYLAQQQQSNKGPQNYYNKGPQNYYNKGP